MLKKYAHPFYAHPFYAHPFMDAFWRPTGIGPVGGLLLTGIREENPTP